MLNANWPVRTETPRAHLGTATLAQTGPDASGCRGLAIHPPAEYHSAKQQTASLRYKPASIRIGGSAKMRPSGHDECNKTCAAPQRSTENSEELGSSPHDTGPLQLRN